MEIRQNMVLHRVPFRFLATFLGIFRLTCSWFCLLFCGGFSPFYLAQDIQRSHFRIRIAEELSEKLRLQVAENSELQRQIDKAYEQLAEVGTTQKSRLRLNGFSKLCERPRQRQDPSKLCISRQSVSCFISVDLIGSYGPCLRFRPPSRQGKLSTDAVSFVLAFLSRFNIDTAQITYRQWYHAAEKMPPTECLRELSYVTLKRQKKPCTSGNEGEVG